MRKASAAFVAVVIAFGLALAACGDDGDSSASDQVCEARSSLRDAVDSVRQDLADGNFGDARDGVSEITDSLGELRESAGELTAEQREELDPQIDELTSTISGLADVGSLDELQEQIGAIGDQFQSLLGEISDAFSCQ